jgi:hypothetical protein
MANYHDKFLGPNKSMAAIHLLSYRKQSDLMEGRDPEIVSDRMVEDCAIKP